MKRIKTKLGVLILVTTLCLLGLAIYIINRAQRDYNELANFKKTTEISLQIYNYSQALTGERYAAVFGIWLNGETSPQEQIATFRVASEKRKACWQELHQNLTENSAIFSPRFVQLMNDTLKRDQALKKVSDFILDPNRPLTPDDKRPMSSESNMLFDSLRTDLESLLPLLALEAQEAGAVKLLNTQETIARLRTDLLRVRGHVSAVLRRNRLTVATLGSLISKHEQVEINRQRLELTADEPIKLALKKVVESPSYKTITEYSQKIQQIGPDKSEYNAISSLEAYQTGAYVDIEKVYAEFIAAMNNEINAYTEDRLASANTRLRVLYAVVGVMLVGVIGFIVYISTSITRPLVAVSSNLARISDSSLFAAKAMGETSGQLSQDACEQAATLEEISASVEEMTGMTRSNLENIQEVSVLAQNARSSADDGAEIVTNLRTAMDSSEKTSKDIANIIKTIEDIAFQTNMLALNAAVEAARAGKAGAGFAVVANEVRNLAQLCSQAVSETSEKIHASQVHSSQSNELSRKVENSFRQIVTITRQYATKFSEIEKASQQSAEGIQQISQAIIRLDKITQNTAAVAEENASSSTEMISQASQLMEHINLLDAMASSGKGRSQKNDASTSPGGDGHTETYHEKTEPATMSA